MTTPSPAKSRTRSWPVGRTRAVAIAVALAAIPLLMVTLDPVIAHHTVPHHGSPTIERYLAVTDPLGNAPLIPGLGGALLVAAALCRSKRLARVGVLVLLTFALCGGSVYAVKALVRRPRPWAAQEVAWSAALRDWRYSHDGRTVSFPSGDVTCAAGLAMIGYLAVGRGRTRYLFFLVPLASTAGRLIGARHYPSDCLAGLLLGMAMAALAWRLWPEPPPDDLR